jgi:hypothetical protein
LAIAFISRKALIEILKEWQHRAPGKVKKKECHSLLHQDVIIMAILGKVGELHNVGVIEASQKSDLSKHGPLLGCVQRRLAQNLCRKIPAR